ncbi:hypothetical protein SCHPADRAFT_50210 [Schizopora paradoxa]|uniref:Uncharacterized protein n=1 Tax=Schizopora paradoxa TaxID=27342 RepID=A0A0H2S6M1_9AGAM|nr:hypothetical protein SCHPADRAFT_50210 [Schizopora paradoxa]
MKMTEVGENMSISHCAGRRIGANRCDFVEGKVRCLGTTTRGTRCRKLVLVEDCRGEGPCPGHYCGYHKFQPIDPVRPTKVRCYGRTKRGLQCSFEVNVTFPIDESDGVFCHHHRHGASNDASPVKQADVTNITEKSEDTKLILDLLHEIITRVEKLEVKDKTPASSPSKRTLSSSRTNASSNSTERPASKRVSLTRSATSQSEGSTSSYVTGRSSVKSEHEDQSMEEENDAMIDVKSPDVTKLFRAQSPDRITRGRSCTRVLPSFTTSLSSPSSRIMERAIDS